jgi:4-hydroxybenzoate polyprenyltransferase
MSNALPLVVDLDGTLTPTDTLLESILQLLRHSPWDVFALPLWLLRGRALFKATIAERCAFSAELLPLREGLLAYLRVQKSLGRKLVLATAADRRIADAVATRLGLFDQVLASEHGVNLKGRHKLAAIQAQVGSDFTYAGDSAADLPIWKAARSVIVVDASPGVAREALACNPVELVIEPAPFTPRLWVRQLRVHQWAKNILLFVPLLTSFAFADITRMAHSALAFAAFSLAASATYVFNDLWDLDSDRAHPRKQNRPLASGAIPIGVAVAVACALLVSAFAIAAQVNALFVGMLLAYLVLTTAYSWYLKTLAMVDVLMLAGLFTLRIFAGSMAVDVPTSRWLLAFSIFIFFSLALIKRCSELLTMEKQGRTTARGRDYRVGDLVVLWPTGVAAGLGSVVVFWLFINAPEVQQRYATPELLWLIGFGLIYWLSRLWMKTARGEMHDDPLVYALIDRVSRYTVVGMVAVAIAAYFVKLG